MALTESQLESLKKSFFNILALFLAQEKVESRYVHCLLKWGFHLHLNPEDIKTVGEDLTQIQFSRPEEKLQRLESIYHLVQMIYMDRVVEDVELEVATIYAEKLGFKASIVAGLFQSIATAAFDEMPTRDVRKEVLDFLKMQEP